jgi:hypothetical protein
MVAEIKSEWWPPSNRNGGRLQVGIGGRLASESATHRVALAGIIESGPIPAIHGVVRWRIVDLCQWIWEEFRVSVAQQILSRELRAMGFRRLSARRRHHAQVDGAIEDFKKNFALMLNSVGMVPIQLRP